MAVAPRGRRARRSEMLCRSSSSAASWPRWWPPTTTSARCCASSRSSAATPTSASPSSSATPEGEQRYFVRKYNRLNTEREVQFEHALVNHISGKGFHIAAQGLPEQGRRAPTCTREETIDGERVTRLFAVYEMLEGEDKYTWISNRLTDKEFENGARVLAQFHALAHDFDPGDLAREQPPIMDFVRPVRRASSRPTRPSRGAPPSTSTTSRKLPRILEAVRHGRGHGAPTCGGCRGSRCTATTTPATSSGSTSRASGSSTSTGPSSTTGSSTWRRASSTSAARGRATTTATCVSTRRPSSCAPTRTRRRASTSPGPMSAEELALLPRMVANANLYILNWDLDGLLRGPERRRRRVPGVPRVTRCSFMEYIEDRTSCTTLAARIAERRHDRMRFVELLTEAEVTPHARGLARGPRDGGHPRPLRARARGLQEARLHRRRRHGAGAVPGRRRREVPQDGAAELHVPRPRPAVRPHHPRRRPHRRHRLVGAQRGRPGHRRRAPRDVGATSPTSPTSSTSCPGSTSSASPRWPTTRPRGSSA